MIRISEKIKELLKEGSSKEERDLILGLSADAAKLEEEYLSLGKDYVELVKSKSGKSSVKDDNESLTEIERLKQSEDFSSFEDVLDAYVKDNGKEK